MSKVSRPRAATATATAFAGLLAAATASGCGSGDDSATTNARLRVTWTIDGSPAANACELLGVQDLLVYVRPGAGGVVSASGPPVACAAGEAIFPVVLRPQDRQVQVELRGCDLDEECAPRAVVTADRSVLPEGVADPIASVAAAFVLEEVPPDAGVVDASVPDAGLEPDAWPAGLRRIDCNCMGGFVSHCEVVGCTDGEELPSFFCDTDCETRGGAFNAFCALPDFTCET